MRDTKVPLDANEAPELRQMIKELGNKLDDFIRSVPTLYLLRVEMEGWKTGIEQRLKTIEDDAKAGREWANKEHQSLATAVQESERRILEKLDEQNTKMEESKTKTFEQRIGHIFASFGWIVTIAAIILGYLFYIVQHLH